LIIPEELISQKIYIIRNCKVMLDKDLADLFDVRATRLREHAKRNRDKFPSHFMFQLTDSEADIMVSQNAIPSRQHMGGSLPFVFTEHGANSDTIEHPLTIIAEQYRYTYSRILKRESYSGIFAGSDPNLFITCS